MTSPLEPLDVLALDATALAEAIRRGDVTAAHATDVYLQRIERLNPHLHAVITVNPRAREDAAALDQLPARERGSLHGVPMLIKDNIDVAGLPTTAGSVLMTGHVPTADAPVTARLRAAGAVILGKANMTEWANFMTLGMPNGYSSHGGQAVNPWGEGLDTGGSSSGSGVAVAAQLCAAAIGTETSGSVVSPAHQNGVVGVKPSMGLVPRTGIVPISHSQDTAGPITRSVRDAALILGVIGGPDGRDAVTLDPPEASHMPGTLAETVVGVIRDEEDVTPAEQAALDHAVTALRAAGARVQDVTLPTRAELKVAGWMLDVLVYEFRGDLNAYLSGVTDGPRTLTEVVEGNDAQADRALRYGQTLLNAAHGTRGDASEQHYHATRARDLDLSLNRGFAPLFATGVHVLLFPGIHGCALAAKAGCPSVALPTPPQERHPAGVLLVAPAGTDQDLLTLADALSAELGGVTLPGTA
ncbi:amidase family protein [Deinococcus sp.]|uniref:amidase family protein n=1 Tax=Deinococcus sp. TaxID=47478 RepID=UPI002869C391|nr:amidase family protein [Deinococcus sp.]